MSKIIGIDLGTGFSCVSIFENGSPKVIPNAQGARTTPSIVAFTKNGEIIVGTSAARQAVTNPKNTIFGIKRFIGKKFSEIQDIAKLMPYTVKEGKNGGVVVNIGEKDYTPEEISAMILQKLKRDAESYLGEKVDKAVITVPAYFNDSQRQSTKDAGKSAGLEVLRIINEPTAASLAYGIDKKENDKTIAVFDIGAGTSDISILDVGDGVFEVLSTNGDSLLGGRDFDEAIVKYIVDKFKNEQGIDLTKDPQALQRLTDAAEKAKCELSSSLSTDINIPFISMNSDGPIHLNETLTRAKFEELVSNVFDKFEQPTLTCIKDSGKSVSEIDEVIMVGGSTRVPYVQNFAKRIFGKEVNKSLNPDEAVSCGAALQSAILAGDSSTGDILLLDVTPLSLAIETMGGIATKMIEKNSTIPVRKSQIFSTAVDNQPSVTIRISQGERQFFADNKLLGQFNLDGIAPAPRGVPQIEVTFDIDANGILKVTAVDKGTGKQQNITITNNSGLSDEEIERMVNEAKAHEEEDKKRRKEVDSLNMLDQTIFQSEKTIKEYSEQIPSELKDTLNKKIEQLKVIKDKKEYDKIDSALNSFNEEMQKIGQYIYQNNQQSNTSTNSSNATQNNDDNVVDADVVS